MEKNWAEYLAFIGAELTEDAALKCIRFPSPAVEFGALEQGAVAVPLVHLGFIRVGGSDAATFLHNLFSNDVAKLAPGQAQQTSLNTAKGRMLANMLLWLEPSNYVLALSGDLRPVLQKKLSMYVLRSKIDLADGSDSHVAIGVAGPQSQAILHQLGLLKVENNAVEATRLETVHSDEALLIRLGAQRYVIVLAPEQATAVFQKLIENGCVPGGSNIWELAMIRSGLPRISCASQESFVAQMVNFDLIGGVNFKKGCYPGQEIIARTHYLGTPKRRMFRVSFESPLGARKGDNLFSSEFGEQAAGQLLNVAALPNHTFEALAVLRTSCANSGQLRLGDLDGPAVAVLDLPYSLDPLSGK